MAHSRLFALFAKQPRAGLVKTRIAQATSDAWAERVALAFLADSLDRFAPVQARRVIVFTPPESGKFFAELARGRFEQQAQSPGNLGERLDCFFATARQDGFQHIVAVGADSPTLPVAYIDQAFQALESHDLVIGPATDGGYYLIGLAQPMPIFTDIPWSTADVLNATAQRAKDLGARVALLPPWYDVDTADDWVFLRGHIAAMRAAGMDPGTPRVEALFRDAL